MANLAFELGFDWNVPPLEQDLSVMFPLQLCLVNDDEGTVISSCNPRAIGCDDALRFRLYDFTDPKQQPEARSPSPQTLQAFFTSAQEDVRKPPYSPILLAGEPQSLLTSVSFTGGEAESVAGYPALAGWEVEWNGIPNRLPLAAGRFELRVMLTVLIPGLMPRFYRVDPEMVIGDPSGAPKETSPPESVRR
ncbi:MAG: hypothetical protein K0U98_10470 [Deltaproteobacteria bacterium]|nr:hypothetical protein [Deltaproteobacteria bacterium]